jgi:chromate transporter
LPGAIGSNLSAYTGIQYAGVSGGYAAALGLVAPSIIVILLVARLLKSFKENAVVTSLVAGFRPAAAGLLSAAAFSAIALSLWNSAALQWYDYLRWKETLIFAVLFFLILKLKKHPVVYIFAAGAVGVILKL